MGPAPAGAGWSAGVSVQNWGWRSLEPEPPAWFVSSMLCTGWVFLCLFTLKMRYRQRESRTVMPAPPTAPRTLPALGCGLHTQT